MDMSMVKCNKNVEFYVWTNTLLSILVKQQNYTDVVWLQYWIHDENMSRYDIDKTTQGKPD